jgi:hypothetical protein
MLRHSVTLGRVWWWAQNWAQSPGPGFAVTIAPIIGARFPQAPELSSPEGGPTGACLHPPQHDFFLSQSQHCAGVKLEIPFAELVVAPQRLSD